MYETSLLIFNNLFTGNDFTQNIKWLDSRLNLKYDFLKCSWNSYCFKYKLARVPEGMNVFHFFTADNLNVQFYLHYLYSLFFPIKGWRSFLAALLPGHTDFLEMSGGEGMKGEAFGQAHCHTSARSNIALLDPQDSRRKTTTAWHEVGIILLSQPDCHLGSQNINCTTVMCHPWGKGSTQDSEILVVEKNDKNQVSKSLWSLISKLLT